MEKFGNDELTTHQVADLLGVTRVTIRNYRVGGLLPALESKRGVRTVYRFRLADVVRFAAEQMNRQITADDLETQGLSDETDHR